MQILKNIKSKIKTFIGTIYDKCGCGNSSMNRKGKLIVVGVLFLVMIIISLF
jgi:hypothetical protein